MPTQTQRQQRHQAILDAVQAHAPRSQSELSEFLAEEGFEVNQATLSRDLRQLGVVKGPQGYSLPAKGRATSSTNSGNITQSVRLWLVSATPAQNQIVLRTPPGGAQPLALALDRNPPEALLGTIAGDDTILAICSDKKAAQQLADELEALL